MSDSTLNNYVTSALSFCAKLAGTDESEDHTFYARNIGIGSVVLDLGGNQGKFSSYMVNKFPCTVYAVEPSPEWLWT